MYLNRLVGGFLLGLAPSLWESKRFSLVHLASYNNSPCWDCPRKLKHAPEHTLDPQPPVYHRMFSSDFYFGGTGVSSRSLFWISAEVVLQIPLFLAYWAHRRPKPGPVVCWDCRWLQKIPPLVPGFRGYRSFMSDVWTGGMLLKLPFLGTS